MGWKDGSAVKGQAPNQQDKNYCRSWCYKNVNNYLNQEIKTGVGAMFQLLKLGSEPKCQEIKSREIGYVQDV